MEEALIIQLVGSCYAIYKQSDETKPKVYKGVASVVKSITDRKGKRKTKIPVIIKGLASYSEDLATLKEELEPLADVTVDSGNTDTVLADDAPEPERADNSDIPNEIQSLVRVSVKLSEGRRKLFLKRCKILARRYGVQH